MSKIISGSLWIIAVVLFFVVINPASAESLCVSDPAFSVGAASYHSFDGGGQVKVRMYVINEGSQQIALENGQPTLCEFGSREHGCVAMAGAQEYLPNDYMRAVDGSPNGEIVSVDVENYYLQNVLAQEVGFEGYSEFLLEAKAVSARSYAYHLNKCEDPDSPVQFNWLDNSQAKQTFYPGKFDSMGSPQRFRDAVSNTQNIYMTYGGNQSLYYGNKQTPIRAEFFDNIGQKTNNHPDYDRAGQYPYLLGVDDPISSDPTIANYQPPGHGAGLSQDGASRWGFGTLGRFDEFDMWHVRWRDYQKILFHYYTGVELRNRSGVVISPENRWNILDVDWGIEPDAVYQFDSLDGLSLSLASDGTRETLSTTITIQNTGVTTWNCDAVSLRYSWQKALRRVSSEELSLTDCNSVAPGDSFDQQLPIILPPPAIGTIEYVLVFDLVNHLQAYGSVTYNETFSSAGWRPWYFRATINCPFLPCYFQSNNLPLYLSDLESSKGIVAGVQMLAWDNDLDVTVDAPFGTAGKLLVYDGLTGTFLGETAVSAADTTAFIPLDSAMFDGQVHELTVKFAADNATPQAVILDNRFDIVGGTAGFNTAHSDNDGRGVYEVIFFVPADGHYTIHTGKTNNVNGNLNLAILDLDAPADSNLVHPNIYIPMTEQIQAFTTDALPLEAGPHMLRFVYSAEYDGDYIWGTISEAPPPIALTVGLRTVMVAHSSVWWLLIAVSSGFGLTMYWLHPD